LSLTANILLRLANDIDMTTSFMAIEELDETRDVVVGISASATAERKSSNTLAKTVEYQSRSWFDEDG
jgi:hypothetical protein